MANLKTTIYITAKDQTKSGLAETKAGLQSINTSLNEAKRALIGFFAVSKFADYGRQIVDLADQYKLLNGRLSLVTKSNADLQRVQADLFQQAQDTRSGYADTVSLYTRLTRATQTLNFSEKQRLDVTKAINQSMIVSGATTEEASRAIIQLSQGLAAGRLQGQDLKSVMEQAPRLAQAIADGMKINIGELRKLAAAGKITSEELIRAILSQTGVLDREFKSMPGTVGQALTRVRNQFLKTIGTFDAAHGATNAIASAIRSLADNLAAIIESAVRVAGVLATLYGAQLLQRLRGYIGAQLQSTSATRAERLATIASAQAKVAQTEAIAINARARVAEVEATIAATSGMARLTLVERTLIPTQQAAAAAAAEHAAALNALAGAGARASGGLIAANAQTFRLVGKFSLLNTAIAGIIGYQIGDYLYNQFAFARQAGVALVGGLHTAFAELAGFLSETGEKIKFMLTHPLDFFQQKFSELLGALGEVAQYIPGMGEQISRLLKQSAEYWKPASDQAVAFRARLKKINADTEKEVERLNKVYMQVFTEAGKPIGGTPRTAAGNVPGAGAAGGKTNTPADTNKASEQALQSLQRRLGLLGKATTYEQTLWEVQHGRYKDLEKSQQAALLRTARAIDQKQAEIKAAQSAAQAAKAHAQELDRTAAALKAQLDPFQSLRTELSTYDELLKTGRITQDEWAAATLNTQDKIDKLNASLHASAPAFGEMSQFAVQAARNIQNSLAQFLFDPFKNGIKGMVNNFAQALQQMLAQAAAAQIAKKLFGDYGKTGQIGGLAAQAGSFLSSYFHTGGIVGGSAPSYRIPAFAFAGAPRYHSGGIAGLASNEVPAILQRGEEVLTQSDPRHRGNGGGGVNIVMNVSTPDANSFRQSEGQIGRDLAMQLQTARRRNG